MRAVDIYLAPLRPTKPHDELLIVSLARSLLVRPHFGRCSNKMILTVCLLFTFRLSILCNFAVRLRSGAVFVYGFC